MNCSVVTFSSISMIFERSTISGGRVEAVPGEEVARGGHARRRRGGRGRRCGELGPARAGRAGLEVGGGGGVANVEQ